MNLRDIACLLSFCDKQNINYLHVNIHGHRSIKGRHNMKCKIRRIYNYYLPGSTAPSSPRHSP